ncbi:hypothetical protein [Arthrobacter sp. 49Tsu3.1M3]|uniref:hypothetical protein n=1 Tax=Arthrobacter sp. 49Tsu3.1M3 TaxID=1279029 RepID=UPI0021197EAC|nr:hypothetical protein [Arthrobacter sp. 49Tsu3.1M3]
MSNPSDVPPQQPGAQPPASGSVPPAGPPRLPANPPSPPGYQAPPPGYQAPPPGYQGQPAPAGGFRFEMPADRPRNFGDALPAGGLSGMFKVAAMPTELKVSYWIWLIGGLLGLLGGVIGLFGSFVLVAFAPAIGLLVLLLVIVALALATAQILLAMKMKEGREWARFALTILAGISLVLALISSGIADGRAGGNLPGFLISLVATVLMWLPNAQAWFVANRGRI